VKRKTDTNGLSEAVLELGRLGMRPPRWIVSDSEECSSEGSETRSACFTPDLIFKQFRTFIPIRKDFNLKPPGLIPEESSGCTPQLLHIYISYVLERNRRRSKPLVPLYFREMALVLDLNFFEAREHSSTTHHPVVSVLRCFLLIRTFLTPKEAFAFLTQPARSPQSFVFSAHFFFDSPSLR